jgi:hypothetical protein
MTPGGANRLLCDVLTTPDQYVVTIEDADAHGASGIHVCDALDSVVGVSAPQQVLWVHTMSMRECDVFGRRVRVRVFAGTDRRGLGTLAFDGRLNIASGALAVGDSRSPERQLMFGPPSIVGVGVFVEYAVEVLHLGDPAAGYPVSGPTDVNVLLYDGRGFTSAVADIVEPWWRRLCPRHGWPQWW